jgi:urate oxidase
MANAGPSDAHGSDGPSDADLRSEATDIPFAARWEASTTPHADDPTPARLTANRYGKAGIRLATVERDDERHTFTDLDIEVRLEGDFEAAYLDGDNTDVLPTDTMRGTCYALAREQGVVPIAGFGKRLVERFLTTSAACTRAEVRLAAHPWERVTVDGAPHTHTFRPAAGGVRTTTVVATRDAPTVVTGGARGLRVLKTTGSAFSGFPRDEYTVLPETRDRIMATTVEARWGYLDGGRETDPADLDALGDAVPATMAARFATHDDSESVQHTLWAMGRAVLAAHPLVAWIRFRMPNEHHVLADLAPYGLDNPNHVFVATDRPFGVIEGEVAREGVTSEPGW